MENFKNFQPNSKEQVMAFDIAKNFKDLDNLPLYLSYCQKYPSEIIYSAFAQVKEMPDNKIKKSRGALFNYLCQQYAQNKKAD